MIKTLTPDELLALSEQAAQSRGDILAMTHLAASGHPGGSLSSIDIYTLLYRMIDREVDTVVISHGHTSPAVYSALARSGRFDPLAVIKGFRRVGSVFEGHVEPAVPGVPWGTGNLGQGLSIACGYAIAGRITGRDGHVFVVMGDGEQQKGQIVEARRFIRKYHLNNITVIIDNNMLQISGDRNAVMPQDLFAEYETAGFRVLEIDGHDLQEVHDALLKAASDTSVPYAIIAHTVMGKGVSFMEHKADYHGRALTEKEMEQALPEITLARPLDELKRLREEPLDEGLPAHAWNFPQVDPGEARVYAPDKLTDNRSGFGQALLDVAQHNPGVPFAVFDCDLAGSVKTAAFGQAFPDNFFQAGITEHNTAAMAGAASTQGVVSVFAGFGMFGIDETYNQQRLNAINRAHMKLFCTHIGVDVGEDGKTHQCIDYLGLMRNLEGYHVVIPCDPNQTDRATRWALSHPGNVLVGMGRSKTPVITDLDGRACFTDQDFVYGQAHQLRSGKDATVFALGAMSAPALKAWGLLQDKGLAVTVVGISCPLAIAPAEIRAAASRGPVFVVEDHLEHTGLASQIAYLAATNAIAIELVPVGVRGFPPSGPSPSCLSCFGLDARGIASRIMNHLEGV